MQHLIEQALDRMHGGFWSVSFLTNTMLYVDVTSGDGSGSFFCFKNCPS